MTDKRRGRTLPGQALVEFAIVMPFLVLLFWVAIDGAAYYRCSMCVKTAAVEAANWYTRHPDASDADIESHVKEAVEGTEGTEFSIDVAAAGSVEKDYTMHVKQADGWKDADVKTVTTSKKFTCSKTFETMLPVIGGKTHTAKVTSSIVGTSSKEGVPR